MPKRQFAFSLLEYSQIIGTITKGKRDMNTAVSLKVEYALGLEELPKQIDKFVGKNF